MSYNNKRKYQNDYSSNKRFKRSSYRKPTGKPTVKQVKNLVEQAMYRNSETKIKSVTGSEQAISTIGFAKVYACAIPSQGAQGNQRIGNKIQGVGIGSKLMLHNTNTSENIWVRCALLEVYDGQMTDGQITSDLFEGLSDQSVGEGGGVEELIKKFDREFFKCHKDQLVAVGPKGTSEGIQIVDFYKKLNGQLMKFNDSVATQPVGTSRFVWVVYAREGDADEVAGSHIECSYNLDYYFKE